MKYQCSMDAMHRFFAFVSTFRYVLFHIYHFFIKISLYQILALKYNLIKLLSLLFEFKCTTHLRTKDSKISIGLLTMRERFEQCISTNFFKNFTT